MATTLNASIPESKPRTRWLGQQVETDSEDEEDDIEVFWETTSIMSGVPTISPNKMPTTTTTTTSTPPRTTSTSTTTTAAGHMTHLAGQKRPANASPPPSYSASSTATKTASAVATAAASLARRRKKRAGEGCDVPIGQAVDSKTLKMVGQLAIKFSTRSSSSAAAAAAATAAAVAANASRQSVGTKQNRSAPFLPLRDSTGRMVNVKSAGTGMTTESKGKTVARAATAPSGTLLDQRARTARRSPPPLISVAPRANHSTSHASSSGVSVTDTSLRSTNVLTTSVTRVEPIEESRPKSDDFDDLFDGDDSFEHILSQYDEESLILNATTIILSQSMGTTTVCNNDQAKPAVPEQKRSDRILHGVGGQVATKMTTSPLPRLPHASSTRSEVAARGASPRRSARAAVPPTTKSAASPATRVMTTATTAPTASTTKAPTRPLPIQRTVPSSSCSQAEAQERLQQELQSLVEQDVSFWSEEGDEV